MILRPLRSSRPSTLVPNTTAFRTGAKQDAVRPDGRDECGGGAPQQRAGLRLRHGGRLGCNHFHFNLRLFAMMSAARPARSVDKSAADMYHAIFIIKR